MKRPEQDSGCRVVEEEEEEEEKKCLHCEPQKPTHEQNVKFLRSTPGNHSALSG